MTRAHVNSAMANFRHTCHKGILLVHVVLYMNALVTCVISNKTTATARWISTSCLFFIEQMQYLHQAALARAHGHRACA